MSFLPLNLRLRKIDLIDLVTLIETIKTIAEVTNIKDVESVDLIKLVKLISEISSIGSIGSIGSLPDTTPRGNEGLPFKQKSADVAGEWISPNSHADHQGYYNPTRAYNDNTADYATGNWTMGTWSLTFDYVLSEAKTCNKIRIYCDAQSYVPHMKLEVLINGAWVIVHQGNWDRNTWFEVGFSQGSVKSARVSFYASDDDGLVRLNDFDFWKSPSAGGDLYIVNPTALTDDTIKGLMRSIGDAGGNPNNTTGKTVLEFLSYIKSYSNDILDFIKLKPGNVTYFSKTATSDLVSPFAGKKLRLYDAFFYSTGSVVVELRWKNNGNVILGLPTVGAIGMHQSKTEHVGALNEKLEIYLSGEGTVKGWVCTSQE